MILHQQIAMGIWSVLGIGMVLTFISALGMLFGYRNVLKALALIIIVYGGGAVLIIYTIWAFWPWR